MQAHVSRGHPAGLAAGPARPSISVFFPAWNEEEYVERTVRRALAVLERLTDDFEIIIVDDASTDRTAEIAAGLSRADPRIRVITHSENRKLGGALQTGFAASTKELVMYSDMDLPFDLDELGKALHLLEYLEADMVCGFRFDRTSEGPRRILYSFAYNLLIRHAFDVHMKDINFSFKLVHRRVLEAIELKSSSSFIDAELVVKAIRKGFKVYQIGVDYFPRSRGVSTLASPSVIRHMMLDLVRLYRETKYPGSPRHAVRTGAADGAPQPGREAT